MTAGHLHPGRRPPPRPFTPRCPSCGARGVDSVTFTDGDPAWVDGTIHLEEGDVCHPRPCRDCDARPDDLPAPTSLDVRRQDHLGCSDVWLAMDDEPPRPELALVDPSAMDRVVVGRGSTGAALLTEGWWAGGSRPADVQVVVRADGSGEVDLFAWWGDGYECTRGEACRLVVDGVVPDVRFVAPPGEVHWDCPAEVGYEPEDEDDGPELVVLHRWPIADGARLRSSADWRGWLELVLASVEWVSVDRLTPEHLDELDTDVGGETIAEQLCWMLSMDDPWSGERRSTEVEVVRQDLLVDLGSGERWTVHPVECEWEELELGSVLDAVVVPGDRLDLISLEGALDDGELLLGKRAAP